MAESTATHPLLGHCAQFEPTRGTGATAEILPDEDGHARLPDTDREMERCELLNQLTGQPVTLTTGDSGARIDARVRAAWKSSSCRVTTT